MSINESLARPYAKAAFSYAKEKKAEQSWQLFLEQAAQIIEDRQIQSVFNRSFVDHQLFNQLAECIAEMTSPSQDQKNFLSLLTQTQRLVLLPMIFKLFLHQLQIENHIHQITIKTSIPLDEELINLFKTALEKKYGGVVYLENVVDETILGGAVISMNDDVIDGSIRNQLQRLFEFSLKV